MIGQNLQKTKYYNLEAGNDYDIFEDFIPQITNFAIKTNFREFYKSQKPREGFLC